MDNEDITVIIIGIIAFSVIFYGNHKFKEEGIRKDNREVSYQVMGEILPMREVDVEVMEIWERESCSPIYICQYLIVKEICHSNIWGKIAQLIIIKT